MLKIVDYQTLTSTNSSDLDEMVCGEIANGWQPLGDQHRFDGKYEQVMVVYDETQEASDTLAQIMGFGKQLKPVGRTVDGGLNPVSDPPAGAYSVANSDGEVRWEPPVGQEMDADPMHIAPLQSQL